MIHIAHVFAVDPGLNGSWAALDETGELLGLGDIPRFEKLVNGAEFANILKRYAPKHFVIERVNARPGQGVTSVFTFGSCYGICIGVACGLGMPLSFITPASWKHHFRLTKRDKDASRECAIQLYPVSASSINLKKHHGRADALLIGRFFLDRKTQGAFA